jgi:hypothetical protein
VAGIVDPLGPGPRHGVRLRTTPASVRSAFSRTGGKRSFRYAARSARPGCPREVNSSHAGDSTCSATPPSKAPRLRPSWVNLPASFRKPNQADQDASGRLMQPTLSKTSTHVLCSERRAATVKPCAAAGPAFQHRRARLLPADLAGPPSVIDSARTYEDWVLTPRHRLGSTRAHQAPTLPMRSRSFAPPSH